MMIRTAFFLLFCVAVLVGWGQNVTVQDTFKKDTVQRIIIPRTLFVDPVRLLAQKDYYQPVTPEPQQLLYNDVLETLPGFVWSLGMLGQPYRRFVDGADASWYRTNFYKDPLMRQEDAYFWNPENAARFYDSRTPWVNFRFYQHNGGTQGKMNRVQVDATQNLGPLANVSFGIQRIYFPNYYLGQSTANYNLFASYRMRSLDDRYHLFVSAVFNELNNGINGGLIRTTSQTLDLDAPFDETGIVALSGATLNRKNRGLNVKNVFRFFTDSTLTPHHFVAGLELDAQDYLREYLDVSLSIIPNYEIDQPVYPSLSESGSVRDVSKVQSYFGRPSLSYVFRNNKWNHYANGNLKFSRDRFAQENMSAMQDDRIGFESKAGFGWELNESELKGEFNIEGSHGFLLKDDFGYSTNWALGAGRKIFDYATEDTTEAARAGEKTWYRFVTHRPLRVNLRYQYSSRHPSFYQTFFQGTGNNIYNGNPNLVTPAMEHFSLGISYEGKRKKIGTQVTRPNSIGLRMFSTSIQRYIWSDTARVLQQNAPGQPLAFGGLEVNFRLRLFKRLFVENTVSFQAPVISDTLSEFFTFYNRMLPAYYGKLDIFYESTDLPIADYFSVGGSMIYIGAYEAMLFDPLSQDFYPPKQPFMAPGYIPENYVPDPYQFAGAYFRFDLFASVRLKSATMYARLIHVNETYSGYWAYFTTGFYPMIQRSLMFGVNWNFLN